MGEICPGSQPTMLIELCGVSERTLYTWCVGENSSEPLRSRMSMRALLASSAADYNSESPAEIRDAPSGRLAVKEPDMRRVVMAIAVSGILLCWSSPAGAQTVGQVFDKVHKSVVVIRARGQEVSDGGGGLVGFTETGSGVLISADGKVMTAAH